MDIYQKVRNGDYNNKLEYPTDPKYKLEYNVLNKTVSLLTDDDIRNLPNIKKELQRETEEYNKQVDAYRQEDNRLYNQFFTDCHEYFGMTNHPSRPIVESKAWEHGHANGYSEVLSWYDEFAEVARYPEKK